MGKNSVNSVNPARPTGTANAAERQNSVSSKLKSSFAKAKAKINSFLPFTAKAKSYEDALGVSERGRFRVSNNSEAHGVYDQKMEDMGKEVDDDMLSFISESDKVDASATNRYGIRFSNTSDLDIADLSAGDRRAIRFSNASDLDFSELSVDDRSGASSPVQESSPKTQKTDDAPKVSSDHGKADYLNEDDI